MYENVHIQTVAVDFSRKGKQEIPFQERKVSH